MVGKGIKNKLDDRWWRSPRFVVKVVVGLVVFSVLAGVFASCVVSSSPSESPQPELLPPSSSKLPQLDLLPPSPPSLNVCPIDENSEARIAFVSNRDGNFEIYTMRADGSDELRLTMDDENEQMAMDTGNNGVGPVRNTRVGIGTDDYYPVWSPDGSHIAFRSENKIYTMRTDGSDVQQLTPFGARVVRWSPDGTRIVFSSNLGDDSLEPGGRRLFVVHADGSNLQQLITNRSGATAWLPDGWRIAFSSSRDADNERMSDIYTMLADGSDLQRLTTSGQARGPVWSPDRTHIAFSAGRYSPNYYERREYDSDIYIMRADGSDAQKLATTGYARDLNWSPDGTHIAFVAVHGDSEKIHTVQVDGSNLRRLEEGFAPRWSPDGSRIAFSEDRGVYVMNADGSDVQRLIDGTFSDWSPDGSRIAFHSSDGDSEIYTMRSDGSDVQQLTNDGGTLDAFPSWSPDRSQIVFHSDRDGNPEIYTMCADGSNLRQLTTTSRDFSAYPTWSPDGTRIAFVADRHNDNENYGIYTMNADGSDVQLLVNWISRDHGFRLYPGPPEPPRNEPRSSLTWSPDGTRIAFVSDFNRKGAYDIYTMNAEDGSDLQQLTMNEPLMPYQLNYGDYDPAWSPDGTRIAFSSNRDGDREIFTMLADGSDVQQLTVNDGAHDIKPSWSPDGLYITFSSGGEIHTIRADGSNVQQLSTDGGKSFLPSW